MLIPLRRDSRVLKSAMDKEGFNKFIGVVVLLIVLTFLKKWFSYSYVFLWIAVLLGYYLPIIDHLFYAFVLRPNAEVSKNIRILVSPKMFISRKRMRNLVDYINATIDQREKLIIHTAYFQVIFSVLTFYVLSSSGGVIGRGLVYGFSLRLLVEQVVEFLKFGNIGKWFSDMRISLGTHQTKVYLLANGLIFLIFSLML